ncbi:MAG TPA: geranylgeranylglycerol-phosphate geranylgeranyltransferase [Flavobacteriaceae bacterium]|nr:geranylgeranylglycerol-phosphate geranylgeranyltransferase [Flavobacteriaceae bacterium]
MLNYKRKKIVLKMLSLFSVVRGYNILVIVIAQYLTSIYILAPEKPFFKVLFDPNLFVIVAASALAIASGYIINNFYDTPKDLINRPNKTLLDNLISQNTKLSVYFVMNFLSVILASYISFRAVVFFSLYIFFIWFYSHKLKKYPFIGNLTASVLAITPFFAVFVYYQNFQMVVFVHATFLFLIISMRELVKDLENIKGDLAQNYHTIPVVYGEKVSKLMLTVVSVLAFVPLLLLLIKFEIGYMKYYFYLTAALLVLVLYLVWRSSKKFDYVLLHNILKFIIVVGAFCIALIEPQPLLEKIL